MRYILHLIAIPTVITEALAPVFSLSDPWAYVGLLDARTGTYSGARVPSNGDAQDLRGVVPFGVDGVKYFGGRFFPAMDFITFGQFRDNEGYRPTHLVVLTEYNLPPTIELPRPALLNGTVSSAGDFIYEPGNTVSVGVFVVLDAYTFTPAEVGGARFINKDSRKSGSFPVGLKFKDFPADGWELSPGSVNPAPVYDPDAG